MRHNSIGVGPPVALEKARDGSAAYSDQVLDMKLDNEKRKTPDCIKKKDGRTSRSEITGSFCGALLEQ